MIQIPNFDLIKPPLMHSEDYLEKNRLAWNGKTKLHLDSEFYDVEGFLNGRNTLNSIELALLGNITGKKILHLQCHFGLDSLSLARMGAEVTGVDFSDAALREARILAEKAGLKSDFICCDIYSLAENLDAEYDIVFTSYGTIGWLPDLKAWAKIIHRFLKPGGQFIFADFHPFIWMYDDDLEKIQYDYFNTGPIRETVTGTYADRSAPGVFETVGWNHSSAEVISALLSAGLRLESFSEYDYSPYNCFKHLREEEPGKFRFAHIGKKIPVVFALSAGKPG